MSNFTNGPIDALIADFRVSRKRLLSWVTEELPKTDTNEAIKFVVMEIANNVYPSLIAEAEQIAEVDEVIQEVVEQQDSYIQPDLAAQILHTATLGESVVTEVKKVLNEINDLKRKRIKELLDAFEQSVEITVMGVTNASVIVDSNTENDDDDNESDDEDNESDEGNESDDEDKGEGE